MGQKLGFSEKAGLLFIEWSQNVRVARRIACLPLDSWLTTRPLRTFDRMLWVCGGPPVEMPKPMLPEARLVAVIRTIHRQLKKLLSQCR